MPSASPLLAWLGPWWPVTVAMAVQALCEAHVLVCNPCYMHSLQKWVLGLFLKMVHAYHRELHRGKQRKTPSHRKWPVPWRGQGSSQTAGAPALLESQLEAP